MVGIDSRWLSHIRTLPSVQSIPSIPSCCIHARFLCGRIGASMEICKSQRLTRLYIVDLIVTPPSPNSSNGNGFFLVNWLQFLHRNDFIIAYLLHTWPLSWLYLQNCFFPAFLVEYSIVRFEIFPPPYRVFRLSLPVFYCFFACFFWSFAVKKGCSRHVCPVFLSEFNVLSACISYTSRFRATLLWLSKWRPSRIVARQTLGTLTKSWHELSPQLIASSTNNAVRG